MSNEQNGQEKPAKRARKQPIDLATAKVADGAVRTPTSVYEILGISTTSYKTASLEDYKQTLASMNLIDLQEESYRHGTPATDNRAKSIGGSVLIANIWPLSSVRPSRSER